MCHLYELPSYFLLLFLKVLCPTSSPVSVHLGKGEEKWGSVWIMCSDFLKRTQRNFVLSLLPSLCPLNLSLTIFFRKVFIFSKKGPMTKKAYNDFHFLPLFCPEYAALGYGEITGWPASRRHSSLTGWLALICINTPACWPVVCIYEALGKQCELQRVTMNSKLNLV